MSELDPDIAADWGQTAAPPPVASGMKFDPDIAADWGQDKAPEQPKTYSGGIGGTPIDDLMEHELKSMYASGRAGINTIHDWLTGKVHSISEAHKQSEADIKKYGPAPLEKGSTAEKIDTALSSPINPMNWPGWALKEGGKLTQKGLEAVGVPSNVSTIAGAGAEAAANVGLGAYGATKALGLGKEAAVAAPRVEPTISEAPEPSVIAEPAEGGLGLNDAQRGQRAQILSRVGIEHARESALAGDRGSAATDFQLSKFKEEPAGQAATAQFEHEKQALTQHAESIVKDTGGTLGNDQDTVLTRGRTIAQPFDNLRDWFDKQHAEDYAKAKERLGTTPIGNMDAVQGVLDDRTLKNTLAADNKTPLLTAVQNQLDYFRENNPAEPEILHRGEMANQGSFGAGRHYTPDKEWARQFTQSGMDREIKSTTIDPSLIHTPKDLPYAGNDSAVDAAIAEAKAKGLKAIRLSEGQGQPNSVFVFDRSALNTKPAAGTAGLTADTAEQFRQFLNSMWDPKDPAKNRFLSRVKSAVDEDVTKAAGEDVYGPARQRVALEHTLLDDPKGIAKAFDHDPKTPMNRATAFNKIPDFLTGLAPDQLQHIVQTLKNMPEEIQPEAKQALSEIRAHYANKILDIGSGTQGQWNAPKVSQYLKNNAANLKIAFADAPELMPKIQDLDSAGRILKTDQSYPGAAAQASSALKRGMMSHVLTRAASTTGAVVGGAVGSVVGAPVTGAAVGAGAGEALAAKAARSSAEKAALKNWESRTVRLSDLVKGQSGPPPP